MPLHTRCRLKACAVLCISTELGLVLICDFIFAGDACRVWRYFESVPEEMSSMRTQEAAAVADRHLRLLIYHSSVSPRHFLHLDLAIFLRFVMSSGQVGAAE